MLRRSRCVQIFLKREQKKKLADTYLCVYHYKQSTLLFCWNRSVVDNFVYLDMISPFSSIFCTISAFSLCGEYVVRSFLLNGVFLPCDHGLDF